MSLARPPSAVLKGFKRVSKIVRWKRQPEEMDNDEDWSDACDAYAEAK